MPFQNGLKKLTAFSLALLMAAGCSSAQDDSSAPAESNEPIKILCPTGAPALSTLGLADEENVEIEFTEGQDLLVSELSKETKDYDMILAPVNLGVKVATASQDEDSYKLDAIVTWGNLYMVSTTPDWNSEGMSVAAFGEGAVPGMVFNNLFPDLNCDVTYYPSVAEASQALAAGQVQAALLAQPVAAAAINKCKEAGIEVSVTDDLQQLWKEQHQSENNGYPQAALFINEAKKDQLEPVIEKMSAWLQEPSSEAIMEKVEQVTPEKLGIPSAQLAANTWAAQNIQFVKASESLDDLNQFLGVFNLQADESIVVK